MRLKTEVWVKAYIRRVRADGGFASVVRHGDDEAGAIFIRINRLDGTSALFAPAPAGLDGVETERQWISPLKVLYSADADVEAYLNRQADFDSDLWIVEVESRDGTHWLDGWLADNTAR
jgi:hypothetical protein